MKSFWKQLEIELRLYIRQPLYLLFSLVMPVVSFYFFGSMLANQKYGNMDFFSAYIPSFCMLILFSSNVFSVGNQVVADKERGIYKRIRATPIGLTRFISVILFKSSIVSVLGFILILIIARLNFHVLIGYQRLSFVGAYILFILFALSMGIILAMLIKTTNSYSIIMMTIFFPMFFLSDAMIPLSIMPHWMNIVANFNPLYHANKILRLFWNSKYENLYGTTIWQSYLFLISLMLILFCILLFRWESYSEKL